MTTHYNNVGVSTPLGWDYDHIELLDYDQAFDKYAKVEVPYHHGKYDTITFMDLNNGTNKQYDINPNVNDFHYICVVYYRKDDHWWRCHLSSDKTDKYHSIINNKVVEYDNHMTSEGNIKDDQDEILFQLMLKASDKTFSDMIEYLEDISGPPAKSAGKV